MRRALMEFDEPSRSSSITTWRGLRTGTEPGTTHLDRLDPDELRFEFRLAILQEHSKNL